VADRQRTPSQRTPPGLGAGGRALWRDITEDHELDPAQRVQLLEACRAKDRLDKLDGLLRGDVDTWAKLVVDVNSDGQIFELRVTQGLVQANATANLMKQLLAALRLPDEATGKRPQHRGPRGAQQPTVPGGAGRPVSSLDRARAAKSG
jgi:hypothetical protein